jgi:hypothetical protein
MGGLCSAPGLKQSFALGHGFELAAFFALLSADTCAAIVYATATALDGATAEYHAYCHQGYDDGYDYERGQKKGHRFVLVMWDVGPCKNP